METGQDPSPASSRRWWLAEQPGRSVGLRCLGFKFRVLQIRVPFRALFVQGRRTVFGSPKRDPSLENYPQEVARSVAARVTSTGGLRFGFGV